MSASPKLSTDETFAHPNSQGGKAGQVNDMPLFLRVKIRSLHKCGNFGVGLGGYLGAHDNNVAPLTLSAPLLLSEHDRNSNAASFLGSRRARPEQYDLALARRAIKLLKYVGILQWPVTCGVKPQFAYAASYLGSRRAKPVQYDLTIARRAIKLLIAGKAEGVRIERGADLPAGFESEWASDSDRTHDKGTYLSHGGHVGFWGGLPLLSRSSRHKSIARSSTHAEIMQLSACAADIVIHRRTTGFLRHAPEQPALLRADKSAAITTAEQQIVLTDVARHIAIRFLYVRELVGHGIVTMRWVSTARNIADIFTKALAATVFNPMRCVIIGKDRSWSYY